MRLLIADDEQYTREGLRNVFDWDALGIHEVMLARDGKDALTIARWFLPDVVITDIKMPRRDGIHFARELTGFLPQCKLLFISGYMEVDYFKNALQLSAVDYVLKPIDKEQLYDAVRRAVAGIEQARSVQRLREDNLEMKRNRLIHLLLHDQPDVKWCQRLCEEVGFQQRGEFVCVALRELGMRWYSQRVFDDFDRVCEKQQVPYLMDYLQDSRYVAIFRDPDPDRLRRGLRELLSQERLLIGVGGRVRGLMAVNGSYRQARQAQGMYFFHPEVRYVEPDALPEQSRTLDPGLQGQFLALLRDRPGELSPWFGELFAAIEEHCGQYRRQSLQDLFRTLIQAILAEHPELMPRLSGVHQLEDIPAMLEGMETWQELKAFLLQLLETLQEALSQRSQYTRTVQQMLKYVDQRYCDSALTVQQVAEEFHMSTTYLGILFKRETHQTLKQYITQRRIGRAKQLLQEGREKIADIAEMCGFANANYFAHIFKETEGVTPQEYRKCK